MILIYDYLIPGPSTYLCTLQRILFLSTSKRERTTLYLKITSFYNYRMMLALGKME